jgi:hypothetical protein
VFPISNTEMHQQDEGINTFLAFSLHYVTVVNQISCWVCTYAPFTSRAGIPLRVIPFNQSEMLGIWRDYCRLLVLIWVRMLSINMREYLVLQYLPSFEITNDTNQRPPYLVITQAPVGWLCFNRSLFRNLCQLHQDAFVKVAQRKCDQTTDLSICL